MDSLNYQQNFILEDAKVTLDYEYMNIKLLKLFKIIFRIHTATVHHFTFSRCIPAAEISKCISREKGL